MEAFTERVTQIIEYEENDVVISRRFFDDDDIWEWAKRFEHLDEFGVSFIFGHCGDEIFPKIFKHIRSKYNPPIDRGFTEFLTGMHFKSDCGVWALIPGNSVDEWIAALVWHMYSYSDKEDSEYVHNSFHQTCRMFT